MSIMDITDVTDHVTRIEHIFNQTPFLSKFMPLKFNSGVVVYVPKHSCKHCKAGIPPTNVRGSTCNLEPGKYATVNSTVHCNECDSYYFDCYSIKDKWNGIDILTGAPGEPHDEVVNRVRMPLHSALWRLAKKALTQKTN